MRRRSPYLILLAVLAAAMPAEAATAADSAARGENPLTAVGAPLAQVRFSSPAWYAIVLHKPTKARMLYTSKDVIIHVRQPERSLTIARVDPGVLVFRQGISKQQHSLPAGNPIPGFPELFFTETVTLDQLHFQYKQVERIVHADPLLIALAGTTAVLEIEIVHSAASTDLLPPPALQPKQTPQLLEQVRVKGVGTHTYELAAADLRPVIENVGEIPLPDFKPILSRFFSYQAGEGWRLASPVADGLLNPSGFTVMNPKVARYFGIQAGDTIFRLNGYPVTSPLSAYWAYQETIARNPQLSELRVDLNRDGALITKIYQIR